MQIILWIAYHLDVMLRRTTSTGVVSGRDWRLMQEPACGRDTNAAPQILTAYYALIGIIIGYCLSMEM